MTNVYTFRFYILQSIRNLVEEKVYVIPTCFKPKINATRVNICKFG